MRKASHTLRHGDSRHGAKQPEVFNPARAALLDSPDRFDYLPPERIFAHLDPPQGGLVVDFGAGTGRFSIELAQRRPDLKVIALDEQPEMLELLQAKPAARQLPNIRPLLTDEIDSLKGAADRILAMNVLHELGDATLRGMSRLLKPQGSLLIVDWNSAVRSPHRPAKGPHPYSGGSAHASGARQGSRPSLSSLCVTTSFSARRAREPSARQGKRSPGRRNGNPRTESGRLARSSVARQSQMQPGSAAVSCSGQRVDNASLQVVVSRHLLEGILIGGLRTGSLQGSYGGSEEVRPGPS